MPWRLEDIADRLVRHGGAQIRERSYDAIVAPGWILLGHAHHQVFDLAIHSGSTGRTSPLGASELAGDQLPVPAQNGLRFGGCGDLLQRLSAKTMADLAQGGPLGVGQQESAFQLGFEDAVLGGEIFIAQQELLIDRPGDVGEHASPIHPPPP